MSFYRKIYVIFYFFDFQFDCKVNGKIDNGLVIFVGFKEGDKEEIIDKMIDKIINLRIFEDDKGLMNLSLLDIQGEVLLISQFTLYGDARKGRRPNFMNALGGEEAKKFYDKFIEMMKETGLKVQTGIFGADMKVDIKNDGPVTILLDSSRNF